MGIIKDVLFKVSNKKFLRFFKNQTIFPYYHIVKDTRVAHIENLYSYKTIPEFEKDLDMLLSNYNLLNPMDLIEGKTSIKNSFLLTFDDGLQEVYTTIYPILKKKNITAIFFINPNFVDNKEILYKHALSVIISHLNKNKYNREVLDKIGLIFGFSYNTNVDFNQKLLKIKFSDRKKLNDVFQLLDLDINHYLELNKPYLTSSQIEEMMADGFYFGGHTLSHPPLNQLSHEQQKVEIINSVDWLKQKFKIDYSFFAFPFTDKSISKQLINELFEYDKNIRVFGNSGIKKDIDKRIFQRFSLENPEREAGKQIVTENLYKYYNKIVGKYQIKRA